MPGARAACLAGMFGVLLAACEPEAAHLDREFLVFGSNAELTLRNAPPAVLASAADAVQRRFAEYDRDWHPWRASALVELNAALAAGRMLRTVPSIVHLIERSQPITAASHGLFDPAAGALVAAWGFHTSDWPVRTAPDRAAIEAWRAARPRLADVHVDGLQVRSDNPAVQLDFNAIAEGVAAADALQLVAALGVHDALLNLGGDVAALGDAGGRPWRVALRDPRGGALGWVELGSGEALFASGSYAKFREDDGQRRPHVIDPRSGEPATGSAASAVLDLDPVLADAAATALLVAGAQGFDAIVRDLRLGCALLLTDDDEMLLTAAMHARLVVPRQPARLTVAAGPAACAAGAVAPDDTARHEAESADQPHREPQP